MTARRLMLGQMVAAAVVCGLTALPARAGEVYKTDFEGKVGPEWSDTNTATMAGRRFLGRFGNDSVSLKLEKLPPHSFVTVSFDLFILDTWDGDELLTACGALIGPDQWGLRVEGGPTLIHTTFNNVRREVQRSSPQAYPTHVNHGIAQSRTGAAENNTLGCSTATWYGDSVYRVSYTFPHTGDELRLNFYGLNLQALDDESWGIDNVKVETSNSHPSLAATAEQLAAFWNDLTGEDVVKSEKAVWDLAGAGDRAVALIEKHFPRSRPAQTEDQTTAKLIADLDSDDWGVREKATAALRQMGARAVPALRAALKQTASLEVHIRIQRILEQTDPQGPAADRPAMMRRRAARVLHLIGSDAAKELITRLTGAPWGPAALRPDTRWEGVRRHASELDFPMVMVVKRRQEQVIAGVLRWPRLGNTTTPFEGTVVGSRIEFTEHEAKPGAPPVAAIRYAGQIVGQTATGSWRAASGQPWGGFELRLTTTPASQPE